ncbi:MAG: dihydropyrimidinase [Pirellulales bacterium]
MPLLIRNGRIVTAYDSYLADIYCDDETITQIGPNLDVPAGADVEVIDASDKYVFPGFVDPHVHIYLPFMGTCAKDTHASASRAALVGGTTTLIEMCCPNRQEEPLEAFHLWSDKALGASACDYTFHMAVSRFDEGVERQIREIVASGITSLKVFLAYKDFFGLNDTELYRTLDLARELGLIVTAHCENESVIAERQAALLAAGKTGPEYHEPSRPPLVELEGVRHLMTFAELTGAHVYVVHTSCAPALRAAQTARSRGVNVWVETVIPYLVLDKSYAELPDFEGAKYVMSPPLRDARHQKVLWNALRTRMVSTVATDHAPFDFVGQKEMGREDFTKIPNGIPSVEDRVNLLYTYGVLTGKIDLGTLVDVASTQAAKLFGLYPKKGAIQIGSDADLVVYDPHWRGCISAASQQMDVDYSAFEGFALKGRPSVVTVRGQIQVRDGQFIGSPGRGRLLERVATHFGP